MQLASEVHAPELNSLPSSVPQRLYCRDCGCEWDYCRCRPDSGSVDYQQADQSMSEVRGSESVSLYSPDIHYSM